jgi:hypothetical protein
MELLSVQYPTRQEHPQYSLAVMATMQSGFMPPEWNQTNSPFSEITLLLQVAYMVPALARKGIQEW